MHTPTIESVGLHHVAELLVSAQLIFKGICQEVSHQVKEVFVHAICHQWPLEVHDEGRVFLVRVLLDDVLPDRNLVFETKNLKWNLFLLWISQHLES